MLLFCLLASVVSSYAGDFDGSQPLYGTTEKIVEVNPYKIIDDVDADTIGLPRKFLIDFSARQLLPSKESMVRRVVGFKRIEHMEDKLVLQGIDTGIEGVADGLAWSLTISKKDGRAVLAASGGGLAYVVFGYCTPVRK